MTTYRELADGTQVALTPEEEAAQAAEDAAAEAAHLARLRGAAEASIAEAIDRRATELVGRIPQIEKDSWPTKETAARTLKDPGTPDPPQMVRMIEIERQLRGKGETAEQLCDKIIANADLYLDLVSAFAAIRALAFEALLAASTPQAWAAIETATLAQIAQVGAPPP